MTFPLIHLGRENVVRVTMQLAWPYGSYIQMFRETHGKKPRHHCCCQVKVNWAWDALMPCVTVVYWLQQTLKCTSGEVCKSQFCLFWCPLPALNTWSWSFPFFRLSLYELPLSLPLLSQIADEFRYSFSLTEHWVAEDALSASLASPVQECGASAGIIQ